MRSRLASFLVWALVAGSIVFWALRLTGSGARAPAHAAVAAADARVAGSSDLSRLFGGVTTTAVASTSPSAATPADARFKLIGLVAERAQVPTEGLALISVDGKPARAVGLGGTVDDAVVLLAVGHRRAELGPRGGPAQVTLELPALAEAARSATPPPANTVPIASGRPMAPPAPVVSPAPLAVQNPQMAPAPMPSEPPRPADGASGALPR